jgi:hypothetical protein
MLDEICIDNESLEKYFKQPYIQSVKTKINPVLAKPIELKAYSEIVISNKRIILSSALVFATRSLLLDMGSNVANITFGCAYYNFWKDCP